MLALDVKLARWYPEANDGPSVLVATFAARGRAPEIPGPLIRVSAGTHLDVTVHNRLTDSTVWVHGLVSHPGVDDSVALAPGTSHRFRFAAGAPGTYFYWGRVGVVSDSVERDQLAGAFVVDAPGAPADDRVFVMNIWGDLQDSTAASPFTYRNALAINGKSWPYTERLSFTVGDSVRWRWINATGRNHPMHLHGFYFQIDARGTGLVDTLVADERLTVTDQMRAGATRRIHWVPTRPGNWLFHCHITFHVVAPDAVVEPGRPAPHEHMAGLVLGIVVRPAPDWVEPPRPSPRRVDLVIEELPRRGGLRTLGVAVAEAGTIPPAAQSPGPPLIVNRDQPTDVTVRNRLAEPTAIHWHGLELESYSDGVAGWSGSGDHVAPTIAAGGAFTARLTLRRAGTFIYHTHLNDLDQLTAGLYGAIVVLEPGATFDPSHDHVFVTGWNGVLDPPRVVLNGDTAPPPLELAAGQPHRLRFVNIGPAQVLRFAVGRDSTVGRWQPVAADGAALAPSLAVAGPARVVLPVGATADVDFTPPAPGAYQLTVAIPGQRPLITQRLVVR